MCISRRHGGLTLIELIVFIVIVSVGLAGILAVFNVVVKNSADPVIRKDMLSIAEALLEEVELQPFTYCDPTDATWTTATSATTGSPPTTCTSIVQGLGPGTTGQVRVSTTVPFNNVADYNGLALPSPILDISGTNSAPAGYSASISIVPEALGAIASGNCASGTDCSAMNVVRIVVTVTHGGDSLTLEGYRARYWPNDQPW